CSGCHIAVGGERFDAVLTLGQHFDQLKPASAPECSDHVSQIIKDVLLANSCCIPWLYGIQAIGVHLVVQGGRQKVTAYLEAVMEEDDDHPSVRAQALGASARSQNFSEIA
ncbi:MAG: hypothetical protein L0K41_07095, partial [Yaniella sp.]|nr:hypothetical protein [Yaniella sp.]